MDQLWAPWRMEYIKGSSDGDCVLCLIFEAGDDAAHNVLFRGRHTYVVMNRYPYSNGHLMIAPFAHVPDYTDLDEPTLVECSVVTQKALLCLREAFAPDGINIGLNLGRVAGAGIVDHVHLHVVPRWEGDTNFMPVVADTKVISEHIRRTYERLRPYFEKITLD
ncbi:HIT domain-containing protein [Nitrospinae bacterium AH_259_B05_G02_I21]|nr:HIT domain-containing protein [Nitrospinae bacterium AH_259_B05_G02_I21]MDA2931562.1 HIT domain-containing protein [Nitrospinae bacterium AH-259-F20]